MTTPSWTYLHTKLPHTAGTTETASLFSETKRNMEEGFLGREGILELRIVLFKNGRGGGIRGG